MSDIPTPPGQQSPEPPEPANLRFLRRLVTVLTAVMIGGLLTVIVLLVIRFPAKPSVPLPDEITLPEGLRAEAVTFGAGWIAVVAGDEILIYGRENGELRQRIAIEQR